MIWSVMVTKFGTVRGVIVGTGAGAGGWAYAARPNAPSSATLSNISLIGHLIEILPWFETSSPGFVVRWCVLLLAVVVDRTPTIGIQELQNLSFRTAALSGRSSGG